MSKSRQEKSKTPAQSAAPQPVSNDIVSGRFTDSDWNQMLETEDGEDFIHDIVEEVVASTMVILHDQYIKTQTLPYAVQETRKLLLSIIEWQFLACDGGEENTAVDPTWLEEEEPVAPVTDSWAQGSVPVVMQRSSSTASSATSVISEANSEDSCIEDDRPGEPEPPFQNVEVADTPLTITSPIQPATEDTTVTGKIIQPKPPTKPLQAKQKKRSGPFKPHRGKLPAFSAVDMTSVTDIRVIEGHYNTVGNVDTVPALDGNGMTLLSSSTSILKTQHGRPPGNKDVVYDEWGNVTAVIRLNLEKLPSHRVRTKFTVVEQDEVTSMRSKAKGPANIPTYVTSHREANKGARSGKETRGLDGASRAVHDGMIYTQSGGITPLPPPLVDSMDINPGVVVREGDVVRRGPRQVLRQIDRRASPVHLQPLDSTSSARGMSEVVTRSSPVIRPLHLTEPIPPIPAQPSPHA